MTEDLPGTFKGIAMEVKEEVDGPLIIMEDPSPMRDTEGMVLISEEVET